MTEGIPRGVLQQPQRIAGPGIPKQQVDEERVKLYFVTPIWSFHWISGVLIRPRVRFSVTTHRNHYVPQWYQRRFVRNAKTPLFYLDLAPERTILPDGRAVGPPALQRNSPKYCFWGQDLYTTVFGGVENDEVERFLFGTIDSDGANAVRAIVEGDLRRIHDHFRCFFEYLDAQKLRTPKGLDWIRSKYPELNQVDLMLEMQHLRQMHCTMWMESVREIVSAEESEIKFIITDHPVTIYHPDCPPNSLQCAYPDDPDIARIGAQTLFPLGNDHCLILTNLQYAESPERSDLLEERENARHFGGTISRTDAWIRTRRLDAGQVVSINHILKARARRFIAATEESWLYPERSASPTWSDHAKVLLPPEDELWHFGGEIYVGHKDGKSSYQDEFGGTSKAHEYLTKDPPAEEPRPEDWCTCGSGYQYRECCRDLDAEDRPPSNLFGIRERNLMFIHAIDEILGLNAGKNWEDVRRELSGAQVARIHSAYASLWPRDTDLADLLPRPDVRKFRALYVGLIDPRTIAASVIAWVPYFDEILVLNPFMNAAFVRPEYSPIESPEQFKEQTIKNVALLYALLPYVQAGIVNVVPDPLEFNETFRQMAWSSAEARAGGFRPSPDDLELACHLGRDDLRRAIGRLPDDALRRQLRLSSPGIAEDELEATIAYIRAEHSADPLALIQIASVGNGGSQLQQFRGINFELAVFLAQLTGAALYSDQQASANDLMAASTSAGGDESGSEEHRLKIRLSVGDESSAMMARRDVSLYKAFRNALLSVWKASVARKSPEPELLLEALQDVEAASQALRAVAADAPRPDSKASQDFEIDAALMTPSRGYSLKAAQRLVLAFGRRKHISSVPVALLFGRSAKRA